jgi:hypothetical protein
LNRPHNSSCPLNRIEIRHRTFRPRAFRHGLRSGHQK